jgi:hypothetical protein
MQLTESSNCIFNRVELLCNLCCGRHLRGKGGVVKQLPLFFAPQCAIAGLGMKKEGN